VITQMLIHVSLVVMSDGPFRDFPEASYAAEKAGQLTRSSLISLEAVFRIDGRGGLQPGICKRPGAVIG